MKIQIKSLFKSTLLYPITFIWLSNSFAADNSAAGRIPANCNRSCLEQVVDRYLDALVAHEPGLLPFSSDVKYTENGQVLEIGDGFWGTASGRGNYRHYIADPAGGQVGFFGTMKEANRSLLLALRLRIQLGMITEVESGYYRTGSGPSWNDVGVENLEKARVPEGVWQERVPANRRVSRQELIATANKYFAGLQNNDGLGEYPFTDDCNRLENGVATTNNDEFSIEPGGPLSKHPFAMGCKEQFLTGYYGVVTRIHQRRFPVVDEERGIVLAFAVFDHAGTVREVTIQPGGEKYSMAFFNRPSSILIFEAFKIENGLIRRVEALGTSVPYHLDTHWGGISGN